MGLPEATFVRNETGTVPHCVSTTTLELIPSQEMTNEYILCLV